MGRRTLTRPQVGQAVSPALVALAAVLFTVPLVAQSIDRTKPPSSPPAKAYKLPPTSETRLPNGLTVVLAEDARFPLVTVRLSFLAGNKRDPQELPGLAAAAAGMLAQGTNARTYQQIAEELDGMGGVLTTVSGADSITMEGSVLSEGATKLLALMADEARNATFPEDQLALLKQNRKQVLAAQRSQPAYLAGEEFRKRLFGDQPYAHIGPTSASIDRMDRKAIADFRDAYLVPNNAFLIVAGKFTRAEMLKTITNEFGAWQQKPVPAYAAPPPPPAKRQLVLIDRPGSVQADVRMGKIGPTYRDPDFFPETVGSLIEGGGLNSRLFNDIREKRGYAYDVHTEVAALADAATFSVVTQLRNEIAADGLQGIIESLDRMANEPVTAQEISDAKAFADGNFLLGMEPQRGLADRLVQIRIMNQPKDYLETYTAHIDSVEPDQILAAAKKIMATDNETIVVVGDAAKIQQSLEKIGKFEVVKPAQ